MVDQRGRITASAEADVRRTLVRMVHRARKSGASILIAATEASRRAANGQAVPGPPGRPCRGSDSPAVARPRGRARASPVSGRACRPGATLIVIDSGGASTEATLTAGRTISSAASLPVGAALLAGDLKGDPPAPIDWALTAISNRGDAGVACRPVIPVEPSRPVGRHTACWPMAAIGRRQKLAAGVEVTLVELERTSATLLARPAARVGGETGLESGRVALLAPGVLILAAILRAYGLAEFQVLCSRRSRRDDPGGRGGPGRLVAGPDPQLDLSGASPGSPVVPFGQSLEPVP